MKPIDHSTSISKSPTSIDVTVAQKRIASYVPVTPIIHSPLFYHRYGVNVYVKADSCTATGAFKLRGAMNALCCLSDAQKEKGVVAFSTGNHAQAVAYAASVLGVETTIIMPESTPDVKISNTRAYGAEVVLFNPATEQRESLASTYTEKGVTLIHPYDDFDVIAGQGVSGLECGQQLAGLGVVPDKCYLSLSGGGYIAGFSLGIEDCFPETEVIGIEPKVAAPWLASLQAAECKEVSPSGPSICDAIMPPTPKPGDLPWGIVKDRLAGVKTIVDEDALLGMACSLKYFGLLAEPSGACSLGVILRDAAELKGQTLVAVVSGRNASSHFIGKAVELMDEV